MIPPKTLTDLGWPRLCGYLAARCHTAVGAERAAAAELLPTPEAAGARVALVTEARAVRALGELPPFGGIEDLREVLDTLGREGGLDGVGLWQVTQTLLGMQALRRFWAGHRERAPGLWEVARALEELPLLTATLESSLEPGGRLADAASPSLGGLRRKVVQLTEELGRRAKALVEDPDIAPHLQDRFYTRRDDRFVVPVKLGARSVVKGIVHGLSGSGQTVFIEPAAMVEATNELRLVELALEDEERRILGELSAAVRAASPDVVRSLEVATALDLLDASARLAEDLGAEPVPPGDGGVHLVRARHPLMVLDGRACVPNDVRLPPGSALVISGPNAGGKTVALKTTGLCALMLRAGLHLPCAEGSSVPFFSDVLTDVGDDQSLESDLSTFSAHVAHLRELVATAWRAPRLLCLVDEIAAGTDPVQGAALAQAVLEALVGAGAQVIVTTHYDRLKTLAGEDARFANASVGFDLQRMAPTFELHHGIPGGSGALAVARRFGLDEAVVARAEGLLAGGGATYEKLLAQVEDERARLAEERKSAQRERAEAQRLSEKADARLRELDVQFRKARKLAYDEVVAALRNARAELDQARAKLRAAERPDLAQVERQIDRAAEKARLSVPRREPDASPPPRAEDLVPGSPVRLLSMGVDGTVLASPEKGRVLVQAGPTRIQVKLADLRIGKGPAVQAKKERGVSYDARLVPDAAPPPTVTPRHDGNTLDLRGERVEEALSRVDEFLDGALRRGWDAAYVLHGHGTGALKSAVRQHLSGHPAAMNAMPAAREDGGDAVTVVILG